MQIYDDESTLSLSLSSKHRKLRREKLPKKSVFNYPKPLQDLVFYAMKVGRREGVLRQRPPRSYKSHLQESVHVIPIRELATESRRKKSSSSQKVTLILLVFISFNILELANGKSCGYNEMRQCNENKANDCSCVKCLVCPPGQGLYPQCGSTTLRGNVAMKCLPCKGGTYSDESDFGSCHACHVCDHGQEMLQQCNATQNAICKKGCKDGYRWNELFLVCEEVPTIPSRKETTTHTSRPYTAGIPTSASTNVSGINDSGPSATIPTTTLNQKRTSSQKPATARPTAKELLTLSTSINTTDGNSGSDSNKTIIKTIERIAKAPDLVHVLVEIVGLLIFFFIAYISYRNREKIKRFIRNSKTLLQNDEQIKGPIDQEAIPMNPIHQEEEQEETMMDLTDQSPPGQQVECFAGAFALYQDPQGQGLEEIISGTSADQQTLDQNHDISRPPALRQRQECFGQDTPGPDSQVQGLEEVVISSPSDPLMLNQDQVFPSPPGQQGESSDQGTPKNHDPRKGADQESISSPSDLQPIDDTISCPLEQGERLEEPTAMPDVPDLCGQLMMKDLTPELKCKVSVKISKKGLKGWVEIARFLKVADDDELECIETTCSYGESKLPGKQLFQILEARFPSLSVKEFIEALKAIERLDVISCILEECNK